MSYEMMAVITLLKIIQQNIVLLDPLDQESQKSISIAKFKTQTVGKLKQLETLDQNLKESLDQDIAEDLLDILQN